MKKALRLLLGLLAPVSMAMETNYIYEKHNWGFEENHESRSPVSKTQLLDSIESLAKPSNKNLEVSENLCGEKSFFTASAHWSCDKEGWKNNYELVWNKIVKEWKESADLFEVCAFKSESTAQSLYLQAQKSGNLESLLEVASRYPFTLAGMGAIIYAARLNLEFGEFATASLLFDTAIDRGQSFPKYLGKHLTAKVFIDAAFAGKRSGLKDPAELSVLMKNAKAILKAEPLTIGRKKYFFTELEAEFEKTEKVSKDFNWNARPYSFVFPERLRELENTRAHQEGSEINSNGIQSRINRETSLYYSLLRLNPKKTQRWVQTEVDNLDPNQIRLLEQMDFVPYLSDRCHHSKLTYKPLWIFLPGTPKMILSKDVPSTQHLEFAATDLNEGTVEALKSLTKLSSLKLNGQSVDAKLIRRLHPLKNLAHLDLTPIFWEVVAYDELRGLENLSSLRLARAELTPNFLAFLQDLPRLETLDLIEPSIREVRLSKLRTLKKLTALTINGSFLEAKEIEDLLELQNLTSLNLGDTGVTIQGIEKLRALKNLRRLFLSNTQLKSSHVKSFHAFDHLTHLSLYRSDITNDAIEDLNKLKKLEYLNIGSTYVKESGLRQLKIPTLKELKFSNDISDDAEKEILKNNPGLILTKKSEEI